MANIFQGTKASYDKSVLESRFGIVVSRFNESITTRLLAGAIDTLVARGVPGENIDVAWVPGAFEIPTVASQFASGSSYQAVICLGCVIRGETAHDRYINDAVSHALAQLGAEVCMPVLFGILTCETLEQAVARSCGLVATTGKDSAQAHVGNKGVDCAEAALEMVSLMRQLKEVQNAAAHGERKFGFT
jgi:6,7-dimethyl-8-ribityllumazine synthase